MNKAVMEALGLKEAISGYTHSFYNYPARFHPKFVKAVIETFTNIGDCVIDPFMGGGTTAVEAVYCGRKFLGIDINPLSTFSARVKTTPLAKKDIRTIREWVTKTPDFVNLHRKVALEKKWAPYVRNMPWWIRKTITILLRKINKLDNEKQKNFIRCGILTTGQWALDCKTSIPSSKSFLAMLQYKLNWMINDLHEYQGRLRQNLDVPLSQLQRRRKLICRPVAGIEKDKRVIRKWTPAKLVLTSPPYPGVHVVYNRWQVMGRKETPAPYWIINSTDGNGLSYYTLGDRKEKGLKKYFQNLCASFESIKHFLDKNSTVVQLVGFSDPSWQLKRYLGIMADLGLREIEFSGDLSERYYRRVPNRKWYTQYRDVTSSSDREFLLVHKLD